MSEEFINRLRSTRDDYDEEQVRHRFHLDAFAGTGGFRGRVKLPASGYWGAAAEAYSQIAASFAGDDWEQEIDSYLDAFPREDAPKFKRRVSMAHYENHVEPVVTIPLSYMTREPWLRDLPDPVTQWVDDADWIEMVHNTIQKRAAVLGYCPVLFDMPPADGMSLAQAKDQGAKLRAIPLLPAHLLDWDADRDGVFLWVKTRIVESQRDPLGGGRNIERITVWYPDHADVWEIVHEGDEDPSLVSTTPEVRPHDFGEVPIKVLQWNPIEGDSVRGLSMLESVAPTARRMFNLVSELDEHIRMSAFSFLQVPIKDPKMIGTIVAGNGNAMAIDPSSNRDFAFISPSPAVADILEKRIEELRKEIYRMGRIEFTQAISGGVQSGVSRAFEFEPANRAIADAARRVALFEQSGLRLVARMHRADEREVRVTPPKKFAVEDMIQALDEAAEALSLDLGDTAHGLLLKRMVRRLLPNLPPEKLAVVDEEIDELRAKQATAAAQEVAAINELLTAKKDPPVDNAA